MLAIVLLQSSSAASVATASSPEPMPQWVSILKELLPAIGGLWPILLIGVVVAFVVVYRKEIRNILQNRFRFKAGSAEFEAQPFAAAEQTVSPTTPPPEVSEPEGKGESSLLDKIGAIAEEKIEVTREASVTEPQTADQWRSRMFAAFAERNFDEGAKAFERLKALAGLEADETFYYFLRYRYVADSSALDHLLKFYETAKDKEDAAYWIAYCYESGDLNDKAVHWFRKAIESAKTSSARVPSARGLARALSRLGNMGEARRVIRDELERVRHDLTLRLSLYDAQVDLFEKEKDYKSQALMLEKIVEHEPNDLSLRFKIAYAYSEADLYDLAALHYERYLSFSPDEENVLNNLGVSYNQFNLPIETFNLYERASKRGYTLASANLAYRLIATGDVDRAREILSTALKAESVHTNVNKALAYIDEQRDNEAASKEELLAKASRRQLFFRSYAEAMVTARKGPPASWKASDGKNDVEVTLEADILSAFWEENGVQYRLSGILTNRAAEFTVKGASPKHSALRPTLPLLTALMIPRESAGYLYLDNDGTIQMMEIGKATDSFSALVPSEGSQKLTLGTGG